MSRIFRSGNQKHIILATNFFQRKPLYRLQKWHTWLTLEQLCKIKVKRRQNEGLKNLIVWGECCWPRRPHATKTALPVSHSSSSPLTKLTANLKGHYGVKEDSSHCIWCCDMQSRLVRYTCMVFFMQNAWQKRLANTVTSTRGTAARSGQSWNLHYAEDVKKAWLFQVEFVCHCLTIPSWQGRMVDIHYSWQSLKARIAPFWASCIHQLYGQSNFVRRIMCSI